MKKPTSLYVKPSICPVPETTNSPKVTKAPEKVLPFPSPSETYPHGVILKAPDIFKLFWKYDSEKITFEIMAKTTGWVGFGLSPNGGMKHSDVVMGWVIGGKTVLEVLKKLF